MTQMTQLFNIKFVRPINYELELQIRATSSEEANQKAWEALLVDEQRENLLWKKTQVLGSIAFVSAAQVKA
jgi:hypothetical protein